MEKPHRQLKAGGEYKRICTNNGANLAKNVFP